MTARLVALTDAPSWPFTRGCNSSLKLALRFVTTFACWQEGLQVIGPPRPRQPVMHVMGTGHSPGLGARSAVFAYACPRHFGGA
jgi:hypothetical protein